MKPREGRQETALCGTSKGSRKERKGRRRQAGCGYWESRSWGNKEKHPQNRLGIKRAWLEVLRFKK